MKKYYLLLVLLSVVLTGCIGLQKKVVEPKTKLPQSLKSIALIIKARIEKNWIKPEPIVKGLQVKIQIRTKSDGSLVSSKVIEPSGNAAFDRSALEAIKNGFPIKELGELKSEVYERNYRKFNLVFNPE
ncbi:TonB C-terminal domain-containing protein [Zooshikella marina]|uniref:energy transducer TonB n=1 Tax=Zooshikella ganghwensis TaxID=202772 RepID=UPI001BAE9B70|nr:energy transducer TonB [Zooshikella ganghwensis]MBU2709232.1 TonB C-terminal domain-containing protein [Zooshikella ganghwensis]